MFIEESVAPWFFALDLAPRSSLRLFRRMMRDNRVAHDWVLLRALEDLERDLAVLGAETGDKADAILLRHARRLAIAQIFIYFDTIYCSAPKVMYCEDPYKRDEFGVDVTEELRAKFPMLFYDAMKKVERAPAPRPEEFELLELWRREGRAVTEAEYPFWLKRE